MTAASLPTCMPDLTPKQRAIAMLLARQAPQPVSRDAMMAHFGGLGAGTDRLIDVYVCKLRRVFGDSIRTHYSRGYSMTTEAAALVLREEPVAALETALGGLHVAIQIAASRGLPTAQLVGAVSAVDQVLAGWKPVGGELVGKGCG